MPGVHVMCVFGEHVTPVWSFNGATVQMSINLWICVRELVQEIKMLMKSIWSCVNLRDECSYERVVEREGQTRTVHANISALEKIKINSQHLSDLLSVADSSSPCTRLYLSAEAKGISRQLLS